MDNTHKFYKIIERVQETKVPILLSRACWQDVQLALTPYVLEQGNFDNIHRCWQAALGGLIKKISDKRKYKNYTIKLTATEYYASKSLLDNTIIDPDSIIPGLLSFAYQINKAQPS